MWADDVAAMAAVTVFAAVVLVASWLLMGHG